MVEQCSGEHLTLLSQGEVLLLELRLEDGESTELPGKLEGS